MNTFNLIFLSLLAAAIVWAVLNTVRQRRIARRILQIQYESYKRLQNSIGDIVGLVVEIMEMTALECLNEKKLARRLKEEFIADNMSSSSLLHRLPALANVYRNGIVDYLKRRYPSLTPEEIEFCSLTALGASPNTISRAFGYEHPGTLYNKRSRIRKKMTDLSSEMTLEEFIEKTSQTLKAEHERKIQENLEKMNPDLLFTEKAE